MLAWVLVMVNLVVAKRNTACAFGNLVQMKNNEIKKAIN